MLGKMKKRFVFLVKRSFSIQDFVVFLEAITEMSLKGIILCGKLKRRGEDDASRDEMTIFFAISKLKIAIRTFSSFFLFVSLEVQISILTFACRDYQEWGDVPLVAITVFT